MIVVYTLGAISVLALVTALVRLSAARRDSSPRGRKRWSDPLLLDGWNLPRNPGRHTRSSRR